MQPKKPFPPGPYRDYFLASKTGDTFTIQRKPEENEKRWKNNTQVMRSFYKMNYGIVTTETKDDQKAVITVVRGADNPLPGARKLAQPPPAPERDAPQPKPGEPVHVNKFANAKSGDKITINRLPQQDAARFQGSLYTLLSKYRYKFGIDFKKEVFENHAVITITRGIDNPLPEHERRKRGSPANAARKPGPVIEIYKAPEPEPKPEPAAPVARPEMREDESAFWCELFKTSLASAPSADATKHVAAARAGVEAYRARFGAA